MKRLICWLTKSLYINSIQRFACEEVPKCICLNSDLWKQLIFSPRIMASHEPLVNILLLSHRGMCNKVLNLPSQKHLPSPPAKYVLEAEGTHYFYLAQKLSIFFLRNLLGEGGEVKLTNYLLHKRLESFNRLVFSKAKRALGNWISKWLLCVCV